MAAAVRRTSASASASSAETDSARPSTAPPCVRWCRRRSSWRSGAGMPASCSAKPAAPGDGPVQKTRKTE
eukprot:scaffold63277_cov63-Phaeocystis_antarctica.AAC.2